MAFRVVLLGLGGLSIELLDPLIHRGWIPNLEYLLGRGVVGPLTSGLPPFADAEWTMLLTGEGPGTTGFLEGWRKTPSSYFPEVASLEALSRHSSRSLLACTALETVLVGVPLPPVPGPLPPEDVIQVLHWEGEQFTVRPRLLTLENPLVGGAGVEDVLGRFLEGAIRRMIALSVLIARTLRTGGPRMVAIHFAGLDRILARFYKDLSAVFLGLTARGFDEPLRQFFRVLDDAVGTVLDISRKSGNLVILASAHGFGSAQRVLNLNAFLLSRSYLGLRPEAVKESLLREAAASVLRSMRIERGRVKRILKRPGLSEMVDRAGSLISSEIGQFDWNRTRAFSLTRTGITLNVRGVESQGTVNPGPEERALGEALREELLALEDPKTGRRPIREVVWRETLFEGPGLSELPHLIVRDWDPEYLLEDWRKVVPSGSIFSDPVLRTGSPRTSGFYCFSGAGLPDRLRSPRSWTLPEISALLPEFLDNQNQSLSAQIPQGS
jgi:predicted AlkP superfamily phosphohydrolase/phosphomutase